MNKKSTLLFLVFAVVALASCKKSNMSPFSLSEPKATSGNADSLRSALPPALAIKSGSWNPGESIGVFMQTLRDSAVLLSNKKYSTAGSGTFTADAGSLISYPAGDSLVNFTAYYPYSETAVTGNIYKLDVTSQQNITEFMYANNATNFRASSHTTPYLAFQSQMSKINFVIKALPGVPDISGLSVKVEGVAVTGDFDLRRGVLSNTQTATINTAVTNTDTAKLASIYALATTNMSGRLVTMTLPNGREYYWNFPTGSTLAKGGTHTFTITLQPPVEQQLFFENCGSTNVTTTTESVNSFAGWANKNVSFSDTSDKSRIRLNSAMVGNHVLLGNGSRNVFSNFIISGINTKYATKLKLSFSLAAVVVNTNQNTLYIRYNGQDFVLPSFVIPNITSRITVSLDLSSVPDSDTGTLEFSNVTVGSTSSLSYRIDDIEIRGTR